MVLPTQHGFGRVDSRAEHGRPGSVLSLRVGRVQKRITDPVSDLENRMEQADAEGERVCAELKRQLETARALVREARAVLGQAEQEGGRAERSHRDASEEKRPG